MLTLVLTGGVISDPNKWCGVVHSDYSVSFLYLGDKDRKRERVRESEELDKSTKQNIEESGWS